MFQAIIIYHERLIDLQGFNFRAHEETGQEHEFVEAAECRNEDRNCNGQERDAELCAEGGQEVQENGTRQEVRRSIRCCHLMTLCYFGDILQNHVML